MRTDILDLYDFYRTPLGGLARSFISTLIAQAWGDCMRLRVAGFGHAEPYLDAFDATERTIAIAPAAQGVARWPAGGANRAALAEEWRWPLADSSIDRLLVVHGLEESDNPARLMREIWRVLTPDGRVIIVAAHRRGWWSMMDGTPFAHGRPYLKRQLERLLADTMFRPVYWASALYFPPSKWRPLQRAARAWERAGARFWPAFGGVLLVEATKDMLAPAGRAEPSRVRIAAPAIARTAPARRSASAP